MRADFARAQFINRMSNKSQVYVAVDNGKRRVVRESSTVMDRKSGCFSFLHSLRCHVRVCYHTIWFVVQKLYKNFLRGCKDQTEPVEFVNDGGIFLWYFFEYFLENIAHDLKFKYKTTLLPTKILVRKFCKHLK